MLKLLLEVEEEDDETQVIGSSGGEACVAAARGLAAIAAAEGKSQTHLTRMLLHKSQSPTFTSRR